MAFNRRLVSYYKEDELKALLSNPSQYRSIILNNKEYNEKYTKEINMNKITPDKYKLVHTYLMEKYKKKEVLQEIKTDEKDNDGSIEEE